MARAHLQGARERREPGRSGDPEQGTGGLVTFLWLLALLVAETEILILAVTHAYGH